MENNTSSEAVERVNAARAVVNAARAAYFREHDRSLLPAYGRAAEVYNAAMAAFNRHPATAEWCLRLETGSKH